MMEILSIIATSWPITVMVVVISICILLNRRWKQYQENQADVFNLKTNNAVVVRDRDD